MNKYYYIKVEKFPSKGENTMFFTLDGGFEEFESFNEGKIAQFPFESNAIEIYDRVKVNHKNLVSWGLKKDQCYQISIIHYINNGCTVRHTHILNEEDKKDLAVQDHLNLLKAYYKYLPWRGQGFLERIKEIEELLGTEERNERT